MALSVGRASVGQVVLLHDLAVGEQHVSDAPPGVGAPQAAQLARTLRAEARQLTDATKAGGPGNVSTLAHALAGYATVSSQLARRPGTGNANFSPAFVAALRRLDAKWRPAVAAIGKADHVNLLERVAPLLIPSSS